MDAGQEIRDRHKMMWSLGDYPSIAEIIEPAAVAVVEACGVGPGMTVLDVGAGTGNVAVQAARRGARVVASDLTPHLIEVGKARSAAEGLDIEWREADAENLPFEDGSFDVVTSVFGAIFAPHADAAAAEMMRVAKSGGAVGLTAWAADGYVGETFKISSGYMPPPPEGVDMPMEWGDEATARARFERVADSVEIRRESVTWDFDSPEAEEEFTYEKVPPMVAAKMVLPPETFEELSGKFRELRDRFNRGTGGRIITDSDYLLVVARKA